MPLEVRDLWAVQEDVLAGPGVAFLLLDLNLDDLAGRSELFRHGITSARTLLGCWTTLWMYVRWRERISRMIRS